MTASCRTKRKEQKHEGVYRCFAYNPRADEPDY